jgi:hypothetical protein
VEKTAFGALSAIEELRIDSKIGKSKHFNASGRKLNWHRVFGIPVIIANLFVGIVLMSSQGGKAPIPQSGLIAPPETVSSLIRPPNGLAAISEKAKIGTTKSEKSTEIFSILAISLAFGAAALSGVQTFFNFHKASEGHRAIGNRYVHISRQCKVLQQRHLDLPFSSEDLWKEYLALYAAYHQINTEAEAFPTSDGDLKKAKSAVEISPYKNPHNVS